MIAGRASFAVTVLRFWAGKLLNALGVPGIVQAGAYEAGIGSASVRVTVGPLFTVVSVNGIDVYLHRITGAIDGVGWSVGRNARDYTEDGIREPALDTVPPETASAPARS